MLHKSLSALISTARQVVRNSPRIKSILYANSNSALFERIYLHDKMISDRVRVDSYHLAINKYVKNSDVVVDLGTGTGILALLAQKRKPKKVYAIDHGQIIEFAKHLAKINRISGIDFVNMHSTNWNPSHHVNIIIHEQMGDRLFDEKMIENVCDLRDRTLAPDGKILPSKFELFIEPFQVCDQFKVPFIWENENVHGLSYRKMEPYVMQLDSNKNNNSYSWCHLPREGGVLLCNPEPIYKFDLMTIEKTDIPSMIKFSKAIIREGRLDGFCIYFKVYFDDEIFFDTSPDSKPTNWSAQTCIFRSKTKVVEVGDVLDVVWTTSDIGDPAQWEIKLR